MQNLKDISNPTTALNMALKLMAKAFQLNNSTPINNNQRSSSNPYKSQISQSGMNMDGDKQMLMVDDNNVGNQNGLSVISGIANQHGNGNIIAERAEGNGNRINGNLIRVRIRMAMLQQHGLRVMQMGITEKTRIQFQANKFDLKADATDLDEIEEVNANCILMANLGTVEQHPVTVEETRAYFESLYNNLAIRVEKVNTVNCKLRETNADLTTELARASTYTSFKGTSCIIPLRSSLDTSLEIDAQVAREMEEEFTRENKRLSEQLARDSKIARLHAEEELKMMIEGLDRSNEKQLEDFVPMPSKEEGERVKRKGLKLDQGSAKRIKTSKGVSKEDLKGMMQLVPLKEVYVEALQGRIVGNEMLQGIPTAGYEDPTANGKELPLLSCHC
nr:hypothetical protein [Tanacetum cinerariifolium]